MADSGPRAATVAALEQPAVRKSSKSHKIGVQRRVSDTHQSQSAPSSPTPGTASQSSPRLSSSVNSILDDAGAISNNPPLRRRYSTGNVFRRNKKSPAADPEQDSQKNDHELRELLLRSEQLQTRIRALEQKASKNNDWKGPLSKVPYQYQRELTDVFQKLKELRRQEEVLRCRKQIRRSTPAVLRSNELTRYVYEKQRVRAHTQIVALIYRQRKLMEVVEKSVREQQSRMGTKGLRRTTILADLDVAMAELADIQKKVRDLTLEAAITVAELADDDADEQGENDTNEDSKDDTQTTLPMHDSVVQNELFLKSSRKKISALSPLSSPKSSPKTGTATLIVGHRQESGDGSDKDHSYSSVDIATKHVPNGTMATSAAEDGGTQMSLIDTVDDHPIELDGTLLTDGSSIGDSDEGSIEDTDEKSVVDADKRSDDNANEVPQEGSNRIDREISL